MAIALMKIMNSHNHTNYREYFMDYDAEYSALPGLDECCMGSIAISGESNTRYILGGDGVWRQDIRTVTPYRFQPDDDGKVVQNGNLIEQSQATIEENGTVDTTTIKTVIVDVPDPVLEEGSEEIRENGTYTFEPSLGADGFSAIDITVDVPTPEPSTHQLNETISSNGSHNYSPSEYGADYFDEVRLEVDVPTPEPPKPTSIPLDVVISSNGEYDYDPDRSDVDYFSYVSLLVDVPEPEISTRQLIETISDNGTYDFNPDEYGVDYFSNVSLEVAVSADPTPEPPQPTTAACSDDLTNNGDYSYSPAEFNVDYFDSVDITVDVPLSAVLEAPDIGKVVVQKVEADVAELSLQTQGATTLYQNGTYDTTTISSVTVSVPSSGIEEQPISFSGLSASDLLAALGNGMLASLWRELLEWRAVVYLRLTSQVLGLDNVMPLLTTGTEQAPVLMSCGMTVDTSTTPPGSVGGYLTIGLDGNGEPEFKAAYLMQNGTLTDISPYLGQCTFAFNGLLYIEGGN